MREDCDSSFPHYQDFSSSHSPLKARSAIPTTTALNVPSVVPTHCNRTAASSRRKYSSRRKSSFYITARPDCGSALGGTSFNSISFVITFSTRWNKFWKY